MFEAKLNDAALFKKVLNAIKDLLSEASWDCTDDGMALQAMDSSHVALVSVKMDSSGFSEFRCDRPINMGINLTSMSKIMACAGGDDSLTLRTQDEGDSITFVFESQNGERQSEYEIRLMDLDVEHLGIPDTDYSCIVKMPSSEFQRICKDLSQIGDALKITCSKSGVQFSTTGDLGNGTVRLSQSANVDDENAVTIDLREPVNVTFAIKYLVNFCKASSLSNQVTISVSNDVPIVLEYPIKTDEDCMGYIRYYLAPKIDDSAPEAEPAAEKSSTSSKKKDKKEKEVKEEEEDD
jgi:proliferating cell nuclear antigen